MDHRPIKLHEPPENDPESPDFGSEVDHNDVEIPETHLQPPIPACRIVVRCTPEYRDWAEGLADHLGGLSVTQLVTQGFLRLAEGSGYHSRVPTRYRQRRVHPNRISRTRVI